MGEDKRGGTGIQLLEEENSRISQELNVANTNASSSQFYVILKKGEEEIPKRHCSEGNYQSP